MNSVDLNKCCYFMITGASRGIGQEMAIEYSKLLKPNSVVVLLARDVNGLNTTKSRIKSANPNVNVFIYSINLMKPTHDEIDKFIESSLVDVDRSIFELAFVIHNVGTIGDTSKRAKDLLSHDEITDYNSLNLTSVIILNNMFVLKFLNTKKLIINITSKSGSVPFKSMSLYCVGKAARQMYFRVLAEEESELTVLNYSPGPVDTDMVTDIQSNSYDETIKGNFTTLKENKLILTVSQTTKKMLEILKKGTFKSGDIIDYYDK